MSGGDWMSTVAVGIEPSVYLNRNLANKQARINEKKL